MHDLRRRALESNKTLSRKARSRHSSAPSSRANSAPNSRAASRNPSREASDEEGENGSDGTRSNNSVDDFMSLEFADVPAHAWKAELSDRMEQIMNRKRSSVAGREETMGAFAELLMHHYAQEDLQNKTHELVLAILKSVKEESDEKETVVALKALAVTVITSPSDALYDSIKRPLKYTITDSASIPVKAAAVHALSVVTFYSGVSAEETQELMDFYLEIIESDGHFVEAGDAEEVVVAALEEWGFLATLLEELEDATEPAMEAFVEQLDSTCAGVQIAAGENIALLYEKSYTPLGEDEEPPSDDGDDDDYNDDNDNDSDNDSDSEADVSPGDIRMVRRYVAYRRKDQLVQTLGSLATASGHGISKKEKKALHENFSDILNSVENPTLGPRYQNAVSDKTERAYGSRMRIRVHQSGEMQINEWWKLHRIKGLKRALRGGFLTHYQHNPVVSNSLPTISSGKYKDRKAKEKELKEMKRAGIRRKRNLAV